MPVSPYAVLGFSVFDKDPGRIPVDAISPGILPGDIEFDPNSFGHTIGVC